MLRTALLRTLDNTLPSAPARGVVALLGAGTFALGTDAFVISGVLPSVGRDLGVGVSAAGLLITVFSAVYALSAPVLAVFTAEWERRRLLVTALTVFVLANGLAAVAPNYAVLVAARVLAALAAAAFTPAANAVAAAVSRAEERGRALATVLGGLTLASALGVPLGTFIGTASSWRWTFVLVAVLGLAALAGLARALPRLDAGPRTSLRERADAVLLPGVRSALLVTVFAVAAVFTLYTFLAWFTDQLTGVSGTGVTLVFLVYGVAAVISNIVGGWLVDHYAAAPVAAISIGGFGATFVVLAVLAAVTEQQRLPVFVLCVVVAAWSLIGWWFNPAQNSRLLGFAGAQGPVVLSLSASAIYAGQALGGALGAVALHGGPAVLSAAAAGCAAVSVATLLLTARGSTAGDSA